MIIDEQNQLELLKDRDVLLHPITIDSRVHPSTASIIAFTIITLDTQQSYIVSVSHPEGLFHIKDLSFLTKNIYTTNRALLSSNGYNIKAYDVELIYYLHTNKGFNINSCAMALHYQRVLPDCTKTNALIGLIKLEEQVLEIYNKYYKADLPAGLDYYADVLKHSLLNVQHNALQIDTAKFQQSFGKSFRTYNSKCYTQYNFYTMTGRPSNRFGGVNFAALPKEDDTRECFISRFENGCLLELDFNSYHPRLIADIVGYSFGKQDAYEHLAQHYHNTTTPTLDQIAKAKEDTFRQLYGGIRKDYLNIPFFAATNIFSKEIWKHMITEGYVDSVLSGRRLLLSNYQDINEHTLFNYYIQMYETEKNAVVLKNILEYLQTYLLKSVPILYTYDSILFDVHPDEMRIIVDHLIPCCIDTDAFPVKLKQGLDYKNMTLCSVV